VVDFTVQFSGQPRLKIQPGFFRVLWRPSMPPQPICNTVNMYVYANTEIPTGASASSSKA
jgi:hypothetical protein